MIKYICQCINNDGDTTYSALRDTLEDAQAMVMYYFNLIACNGEGGMHRRIEVVKAIYDDFGDIKKTFVLEKHPV